MAPGRKSWAGTSIDDRRAARRAQLLEAGLDLVAESGAAGLTVRAVCRASGVTERYFYENFADREALLIALHDHVTGAALEALALAATEVATAAGGELSALDQGQAEQMSAAIVHAFTSHLLDDPRRARVLLVESFADATLTERGLAAMPGFAALTGEAFAARFPDQIDAVDARLSGQAVVGALVHLYLGWLRGELAIDRDRLERHAVALLLAIGPVSSRS
jgi:AcrR family transcriptional regulator